VRKQIFAAQYENQNTTRVPESNIFILYRLVWKKNVMFIPM